MLRGACMLLSVADFVSVWDRSTHIFLYLLYEGVRGWWYHLPEDTFHQWEWWSVLFFFLGHVVHVHWTSCRPFSPTLSPSIFCVSHPTYFFLHLHIGLFLSNAPAVPLINILKRELGGRSEARWEQWPIPSQRIVMFGENQQMCSKNSVETETIRPTEAPSVGSVGRLESSAASLQDNDQTSHEKLALTETSKSFLYHYKGTKPLIGKHKHWTQQCKDSLAFVEICFVSIGGWISPILFHS